MSGKRLPVSRLVVFFLIVLAALRSAALDLGGAPPYNTYRATVVGLIEEPKANLTKKIRRREHTIDLYPDFGVPPVMWNHEKMRYSVAWHKRPAVPLQRSPIFKIN